VAVQVKNIESKGVVHHLQREGKGIDFLVLWLDCDREGENICFEVIGLVEPLMKRHRSASAVHRDQILRAKFSAVNAEDIQKAIQNLGYPNENESQSVDARQELDLKVGVAFSRFQTMYFQGKYGDLDSALLSYGPCQTPALGFCVKRHDEIVSFQPVPYWSVECSGFKDGYAPFLLNNSRGRFFKKPSALKFLAKLEAAKLKVVTLKRAQSKRQRPVPMNTVAMLKASSTHLGLGPHSTMQVAERLYLSGLLSYPRTESTAYPSSFDIKRALEEQQRSSSYGRHVAELLAPGGSFTKPLPGADFGDHPPITPQRMAHPGELTESERQVYDLVARHFVATCSPDAIYDTTKATFEMEGSEDTFSASQKQLASPGFLAVMQHITAVEEESEEEHEVAASSFLPPLTVGETILLANPKLKVGQTTPPGYLTESDLLSLMDKHGVGTDASMASHINNIAERNYVSIGQRRTLVPTNLGIGKYRVQWDLDPF
jgi:DNA topoisomerase-3